METSMTDKHTPGPWRAEDHGEVQSHRGRMVTIRDQRNIHVATVDGLDASVRGQELANARLIAAAPELLEALEQLLEERFTPQAGHNEYKLHSMLSETQNLARAAIKATKGNT